MRCAMRGREAVYPAQWTEPDRERGNVPTCLPSENVCFSLPVERWRWVQNHRLTSTNTGANFGPELTNFGLSSTEHATKSTNIVNMWLPMKEHIRPKSGRG